MDVDFSDWYRICTTGTEVNLNEDLLAKRWAGIEKVAIEIKGNVLELVRLVLQKRKASGEFTNKFRKAFKDSDSTFQMSGNDLELGVLAGSVLCQMFTQTSNEADTGSLAILRRSNGWRPSMDKAFRGSGGGLS